MQTSNLENICFRNNVACYVDVLPIAKKVLNQEKAINP